MKKITKITYVCEICGMETADYKQMLEHELSHYNITIPVLKEWRRLNAIVSNKCSQLGHIQNSETEKEIDEAIENCLSFEKEHNLPEYDILRKLGRSVACST